LCHAQHPQHPAPSPPSVGKQRLPSRYTPRWQDSGVRIIQIGKQLLDLLVGLLWRLGSRGGNQAIRKILLLWEHIAMSVKPTAPAAQLAGRVHDDAASHTQSRPLKVESSYESVTILQASSSVRCAAKISGSGLIGTLHGMTLAVTGCCRQEPHLCQFSDSYSTTYLTTVSAAAGCADPSSRLPVSTANDAALPA
jgi:hypothetical protein